MRWPCLALLALAAGCAGPAPPHGELEGSFRYGPVKGFLQIPRAGAAGSTSSHRPTLQELGITRAEVFDGAARVGAANSYVFAGFRTFRPSGSATLTEDLTSQGTTFPAGTSVKASPSFDLWRVGYEREVPLASRALVLAPEIGFLFFRFQDDISGSGGERVSRGFSRGNVVLGLRAEATPFAYPLSLEGVGFVSPRISRSPVIYSIEGRLRFTPVPFASAFVGVGFDRWELSDTERPLHNDVRVILGPLIEGGLELHF